MSADESSSRELDRIEQRVLEFVRGELVGPGVVVGPEDDLLSDLLDSVAALRLATFVAEEFEIEIQPTDYVIENFLTVRAIGEFVGRVRAR